MERQGTYEELVESNFRISQSDKSDEIDVIEHTEKSRDDLTYRKVDTLNDSIDYFLPDYKVENLDMPKYIIIRLN